MNLKYQLLYDNNRKIINKQEVLKLLMSFPFQSKVKLELFGTPLLCISLEYLYQSINVFQNTFNRTMDCS